MSKRLPPHLARLSRPKFNPKPIITIFCEGKNSEPSYLKAFARDKGAGVVNIKIERGAGVPLTLAKKAVAAIKKLRKASSGTSYSSKDQFWVALHRDEHPNVEQALGLARQHHVGVAYSNPCFEIWLILHCSSLCVDAPLHRDQAQRLARDEIRSYGLEGGKTIDYIEIRAAYEEACKRAARMRTRRVEEGSTLGNPYTDFDVLTESIRLGVMLKLEDT